MIMGSQYKKRERSAPAVDFYGDTSSWPTSELVHSERLVERSELHDWRIRPHRHNDLVQLFLVLEGSGKARLDSDWLDVAAPSLLIVPARAVHEFEWAKSSDGYALSIRMNLITALEQQIASLREVISQPQTIDIAATKPFISELFAAIHAETQEQRQFKDVSLEALVRVLAIWLARISNPDPSNIRLPGRASKHFAVFSRLVDLHHKQRWSAADYASALGVTPSHLNAICKQTTGKSTLELIHARLVLAAQRTLAYTERNIAGIAHHLGFRDPSYFTRFFKRETGMTPGAFRRRSGTTNATRAE